MNSDDAFEFDQRENRFLSQLPSVLIAVAAVASIVVVNVGASAPAAVTAAPIGTEAATPNGSLPTPHRPVPSAEAGASAAANRV